MNILSHVYRSPGLIQEGFLILVGLLMPSLHIQPPHGPSLGDFHIKGPGNDQPK